jgi:hypothetical protein
MAAFMSKNGGRYIGARKITGTLKKLPTSGYYPTAAMSIAEALCVKHKQTKEQHAQLTIPVLMTVIRISAPGIKAAIDRGDQSIPREGRNAITAARMIARLQREALVGVPVEDVCTQTTGTLSDLGLCDP